ncbi:MAG: transporter substrate-binding domain-containing protein [Motiliproteus sp.]
MTLTQQNNTTLSTPSRFGLLLTTAVSALLLLSPLTHAETIRVHIADVDTTSYTDTLKQLRGKHHGGQRAMLLELTRELMQAMDLEPELEAVSTKQGIAAVETGQLQAVAGVSRSGTNLKWVGPLQVDDIWLFQKSGSDTDYETIGKSALQQTSVCVRKDSGHDTLLQQQGFTQLVIGSSYDDCWERVMTNKVALASLNQTLVPLILESDEAIAAAINNSGVAVQQDSLYIAFSGDTPDDTIQQWQSALEQLQDSALHNSLIHHYYCQQDCF